MKRLSKHFSAFAYIALILPGLAGADQPAAVQASSEVATASVPDGAATSSQPIPLAPESAASTTSDQNAPVATKLDEVVVTATKRTQSARDIPASVDVLKGAKLESIGARDINDFIALVPGVNNQDEMAGVQRKLAVRGVGPDTTTNQTVGIVLGDIAVSDPYGALTIVDPNPWDMADIEVLKGPQGTLFGATSLAGLLRYVPNAPLLNTWEAKGFAEEDHIHRGGSDPTFGAALNVPVGETLAFRAAAIWNHQPGVIDVDTPGSALTPARMDKNADRSIDASGRIMGLWQPLERLAVNVTYMQELRRSNDTNFVLNQNGDLTRDDAPEPSPARNSYQLSSLDAHYRFDWATLTSITGYQTKKSFNNVDSSFLVDPPATLGIDYLHTERHVSTNGLQQEIRLTSRDDRRWTWLTGLYYSGYRANSDSYLYVPTGTIIPSSVLTTLQPLFGALPLVNGLDANGQGINAATIGIHPEDASERALFGETNFDLFSNLRLTGGARLYRAEVSGKIMSTGAAVQENGFSGAVTNEGFSPKAAITFRPFNQVMLYANVSRGFQFGGFNQVTIELPTDNIPPTYKSSTLWNYETGIRTDWFHKTLRFDATVFFLNWKNAQVSQVTSDQQSVYVDNVGVVHSKGVEGTLSYLTPIRGLSIQEDASYIEAKTAVQFEDSEGNEIPVGTLMPSSPKLQETTSLNYKLLLGPWTTTTSIVNTFQGKAYDDIAHDHTVGNYNRMNIYFNVGRNDLSFHPVLTFSATNVFDRRAIVSELGQPAAIAESPTLSNFLEPIPTVYNRPLTFSIRLSMQY